MMKRFSWHSEPGLAPHWYKIYGWLPNRYLPIVMFGDSLPIYKPNRKGGHKHNHVYNAFQRAVFRRSIERRACKCEREFKSIFFTNMALQRNSGDFIKLIFHGRRKNG